MHTSENFFKRMTEFCTISIQKAKEIWLYVWWMEGSSLLVHYKEYQWCTRRFHHLLHIWIQCLCINHSFCNKVSPTHSNLLSFSSNILDPQRNVIKIIHYTSSIKNIHKQNRVGMWVTWVHFSTVLTKNGYNCFLLVGLKVTVLQLSFYSFLYKVLNLILMYISYRLALHSTQLSIYIFAL